MREIKFRVWCNESFYYFTWDDLLCSNLQAMILDPAMQWTGLVDRNGKEIYKGDRLKLLLQREGFDLSGHIYFEDSVVEGIVTSSNGMFGIVQTEKEFLKNHTGCLLPFQLFTHQSQVRVVGNIFDKS